MKGNQGAFHILMKGNQGAFQPWNRSYDDQGDFQPWSWWKVTKGLFNLGTRVVTTKGLFNLNLEWMVIKVTKRLFNPDLEWLRWPRGFSILILNYGGDQEAFWSWSWIVATKGLFNLDLNEREPRRFSTLKPELWWPKGLFNLDLDCWYADQRAFQLWFELLKCQLKGFSTLIWVARMSIKGLFNFDLGCWNVDQKAFQLSFELPPTKSQNLGLDFKW